MKLLKNYPSSVIASEAKQSHGLAYKHLGDCSPEVNLPKARLRGYALAMTILCDFCRGLYMRVRYAALSH
jgi:hypothetical protein